MLAARETTDIRQSLWLRMTEARENTDRLFRLVRSEALYDRPIPERHRIVFYIGHLEAFDWNLLQTVLGGLKTFDASLDQLFAFGIDPVDGKLPSDRPEDWPALDVVYRYQQKVRESLDQALEEARFSHWASDQRPDLLMNVAVEHRLMHAETLAYMLHQMPLDRKLREEQATVSETIAPQFRMIEIPAGIVTLGLRRQDGEFGWDNEFEAHRVEVPAFEISQHKVTNGQYLQFVEEGGYHDRTLWTRSGWEWLKQNAIEHPAFWIRSGANWKLKTMFNEHDLPQNWPVYVSHAEASAYAAWSGQRLPTETEWHRAAYGTAIDHENPYPWGETAPAPQHGYFGFTRWDPFPVNAFPESRSACGVEGMLANGWEWTSTPFAPFPGFQAFPFYAGYSANFFDGMHYVMKGGSARTHASMLRASFRNWFQPHYQYAYAAFRCASK